MAYDIGRMQVAIWQTEEALEVQRARVMSNNDPDLKLIANRSLAVLEDILSLQTGMMEVMMRSCVDHLTLGSIKSELGSCGANQIVVGTNS